MSRLHESDIRHITAGFSAYDLAQADLIGADYVQLAKLATGYVPVCAGEACNENNSQFSILNSQFPRVAVVPVTAGEGLIGGFSAAVRDILAVCGAEAFVTEGTDVTGLQQALRSGADIIFTADDDTCIAFAPGAGVESDNGDATGLGFAVALEQMMLKSGQRLAGAPVLVIGAGPVGRAAAVRLVADGLDVRICDTDAAKARRGADVSGAQVEPDTQAFCRYRNILDATNTGPFIEDADISADALLSAPGIPLCVTPAAAAKLTLYHNPLELGVATMYFECLKKLVVES